MREYAQLIPVKGSQLRKVVDVPTVMIARKGQPVSKYPLTRAQTTIGRRSENDIVLPGWSVSGSHAVLLQEGSKVVIKDLGSRNGTVVDGVRIAQRVELHDASIVGIGDFVLSLAAHRSAMAYEPTLVVRPASLTRNAQLEHLDGASTGLVIALSQVLTSVGAPDLCQVTCIRRAGDYAVRFEKGRAQARLNGAVLGETPVRLYDRDILELAGIRLQFQICSS